MINPLRISDLPSFARISFEFTRIGRRGNRQLSQPRNDVVSIHVTCGSFGTYRASVSTRRPATSAPFGEVRGAPTTVTPREISTSGGTE